VELLKFRLITAEIMLASASLILAAGPSLQPMKLLYLIIFGYMGLGGSATINSYLDRDIDAIMPRTADRPIPSGRIRPGSALAFGSSLIVIAIVLTALLLNPLTAAIIGVGSFLYIVFYSIYLKRRTSMAVVWGGLAGAIPALGGWSVYTEGHWIVPVLIFLVVFFWQPSHFWNLSIYYRDDYIAAKVPVGPAVKRQSVITFQSLSFNIATVSATYLLYFVSHLSIEFFAVITVMNAFLLYFSVSGMGERRKEFYRISFLFSVAYIFIFIIALAISGIIVPHSYLA
jgi:protoheme IX farnesyltransferase